MNITHILSFRQQSHSRTIISTLKLQNQVIMTMQTNLILRLMLKRIAAITVKGQIISQRTAEVL